LGLQALPKSRVWKALWEIARPSHPFNVMTRPSDYNIGKPPEMQEMLAEDFPDDDFELLSSD
jgi:hypothetical protein